jgi:hypothetical protein
MTALRKILVVEEEPVVAAKGARTPAAKFYVVAGHAAKQAPAAAPEAVGGTLKNIALFFVAPFVGLVYIAALPLVGFVYLALMAARAAARTGAAKAVGQALKTGGMMVGTALIGLACVVFFPLVGLAMLAWIGGRAAVETEAPHMA